jgi:hypothetical protein
MIPTAMNGGECFTVGETLSSRVLGETLSSRVLVGLTVEIRSLFL